MTGIDYQKILSEIVTELKPLENTGVVANYIPELRDVDPTKLGIHLTTIHNEHFFAGDAQERFSIQSIAKVLSLALALTIKGEQVWERVGHEPSGSAFNSLVQLEYEKGMPRNPFINPGAIVVCDILIDCLENPKQDLLNFIKSITDIQDISFCSGMAQSEMQCGYRNYALVHLMKAFGNIRNDINLVLDLYFNLCSIEMSCKELAQTFLFLASGGISPIVNKTITNTRQTKRINSVMQMCGFYDEAGEFAFRTGLPGKSGVGGGIAAILPGKFSVAVWSPRLNPKGNSYKGMKMLELLTTKTQTSIF